MMTPAAPASVLSRNATEAGKAVPLSPDAKALLRPQLTARQFLDELAGKGLFDQALTFLAHALPKRSAVWWAGQCVRQVLGAGAAPEAKAALAAAERWVGAQDD